jgi:hypothetical protein
MSYPGFKTKFLLEVAYNDYDEGILNLDEATYLADLNFPVQV